MDKIKDFFDRENIEFYSIIPIEKVRFINPRKAEEVADMKSVIVFLIPYKTPVDVRRNLARFALPKDYHLFAKELFCRFENLFGRCRCYCDNSPADEKELALKGGLGVRGHNRLLINEKYGSYVFIGEIFVPYELESRTETEKELCMQCGKCEKSCPVGLDFTKCISFISQKKNLTKEQEDLIRNSPCKWGCDICQEVCPLNQKAQNTPIEFFESDLEPYLTPEKVDRMVKDGTFSDRVYAWRGEKVVKRNLEL